MTIRGPGGGCLIIYDDDLRSLFDFLRPLRPYFVTTPWRTTYWGKGSSMVFGSRFRVLIFGCLDLFLVYFILSLQTHRIGLNTYLHVRDRERGPWVWMVVLISVISLRKWYDKHAPSL